MEKSDLKTAIHAYQRHRWNSTTTMGIDLHLCLDLYLQDTSTHSGWTAVLQLGFLHLNPCANVQRSFYEK